MISLDPSGSSRGWPARPPATMRWRGFGGRAGAGLVVLVLVVLTLGTASASADSSRAISGTGTAAAAITGLPKRHCRSVSLRGHSDNALRATKIVARGVGCQRARRVVKGFHSQVIGSSGAGYVAGFGCAYLSATRVRCGPGPSGTEGPERVEWVAVGGHGRANRKPSTEDAGCPAEALPRIDGAALIKSAAETYWSQSLEIPLSEWSVASIRCGQLAPSAGEEIVVVLTLRSGTGGSPRPWGIYQRGNDGAYMLVHFDPGQRLVCPSTATIETRTFEIYRASRYEGAYTLCDQIVRYRWRGGRYVSSVRRSFRHCAGVLAQDMFKAVSIRASGFSCRKARGLIRSSSITWSLHCSSVGGGPETHCLAAKDERRWISYVVGLTLRLKG